MPLPLNRLNRSCSFLQSLVLFRSYLAEFTLQLQDLLVAVVGLLGELVQLQCSYGGGG